MTPLVLKVFNALSDDVKRKQLLGNKHTKALCKLNWDYAFKKIMVNIREMPWCDTDLGKSLCENTCFSPHFSAQYLHGLDEALCFWGKST